MFILSIKAWEDEVSFLTFLAVHFSPTDQYLSDASSETLMWLILVLHLQKNIPATYICTFSNKLWSRFSSLRCIHMRMNVYYCEYNSITYAGTARFPSPNICQPLLGYVKFYTLEEAHSIPGSLMQCNLNTIHIHSADCNIHLWLS